MDALLGPGQRAERVLEVFSYGGISPWESFYVVEDFGRPDAKKHANQQWHLFANKHDRVFSELCGLRRPDWLDSFGVDSQGVRVKWGPTTWPLRQRRDVLDRTRVVVMRHSLEPHEAAIPLTLSGMRLGNPRMTGMGAHVQRYFQENRDRGGSRAEPYSYVFQPNNIISTDNTRAADSVGVHPGSARPLSFTVGDRPAILDNLGRRHLGAHREAFDRLLAHYSQSQRQRYTFRGEPLRSPALTDHAASVRALKGSKALSNLLGPRFLSSEQGEQCGRSNRNLLGMGLTAAVELLTHPAAPARYANVVDTGLFEADGGGGYDTHFDHLAPQVRNGHNLLSELLDHINRPNENDPRKLHLDDTLIVVTTEFGRTPKRQAGGQGTNHFPYGYVQLLIGGPVQKGISGAIGEDGHAVDWVSPSEFRVGVLAALGMYPFFHESFAVGDVREARGELEALRLTMASVLGVGA